MFISLVPGVSDVIGFFSSFGALSTLEVGFSIVGPSVTGHVLKELVPVDELVTIDVYLLEKFY